MSAFAPKSPEVPLDVEQARTEALAEHQLYLATEHIDLAAEQRAAGDCCDGHCDY